MSSELRIRSSSPSRRDAMEAYVQDERPNIQERSFRFSTRVLNLVRALPRDVGGQVVGRQIARSGTSVGANVEEAQAAESRRDFAHKLGIARKEARETLYWLRLLQATEMLPAPRLQEIVAEANEIVSVLTAIVKKLQAVAVETKGNSLNS